MNDYDSILERLKDGMPKDISLVEGSILGDILCAVANELARFYDMEINEIYSKAFVSFAQGDYLTNACRDYGIERKDGESDELLRARAIERIRNQASSGNEAHYIEWVRSFSDVISVQLSKETGGKVHVYVVSDRSDESLLADIAAHLEKNRPIGATVSVDYASKRLMSVSVGVSLKSGFTANMVKDQIESVITDHFDALKRLDGAVFIGFAAIRDKILSVDGVNDITSLTIDGKKTYFELGTGQYPALGSLSVY